MKELADVIKIFIKEHLATSTMSILLTIISLVFVNISFPYLLLIKGLSLRDNLFIEGIGLFCAYFLVCHFSKIIIESTKEHLKIMGEVKDMLLNLSHEELIVIKAMFYTRTLPENTPGIESLEEKGIIAINRKMSFKSGMTIGRHVSFRPIMKSVMRKSYFKKIMKNVDSRIKICCWEISQ